MFDKFYAKVSSVINRHLPLKPLTRKESKFQTKPWITQGLKTSIGNKNRMYRHYLKTRTSYSHTKFKRCRNKFNHLLKLSTINYYKEYFVINKAKTKEIWKGIKQLICLKPNLGSTLLSKLIINEHEITNDKAIADQLNKFYSNIGKNLASAVPKQNLPFSYYLDKPQASSFFLSPTNSTEIENIITSLSSTKATGPFSISISLLKTLKGVLSIPLQLPFKSGFTWRPGEIENFWHMTQKSPILILVLRDSLFNGKLCGILSFPYTFILPRKLQNTEPHPHYPKIHFVITHFG